MKHEHCARQDGCERCEGLRKVGIEKGCQGVSDLIEKHLIQEGYKTAVAELKEMVNQESESRDLQRAQAAFTEISTEIFLTLAATNAFTKICVPQSRFVYEAAKAYEGVVHDITRSMVSGSLEEEEQEAAQENEPPC